MKWLLVPVLWAIAACVAVAVLWRLWRGQNVVLRGRFSPRLVRMVVVVLVVLGVGVNRKTSAAQPAPPPGDQKPDGKESLPGTVTAQAIEHWLVLQQPNGPWARFKQDFVRLQQATTEKERKTLQVELLQGLKQALYVSPKVAPLLQADLDALVSGKAAPPVRATELLAVLEAMEHAGQYDHWLIAHLWRKTAALEGTEERRTVEAVFARLAQHARVANTLLKAQARVKPLQGTPRAWMSKAGPRPGMTWAGFQREALAEMLGATKTLYAVSDVGTWKRDGVVLLTVAKESPKPTLLREGQRQELEPGETVRLTRLDLIETPPGDKPVTLEHAWLGPIQLQAGRTSSVWDLSRNLPADARAKAQAARAAALANREDAALRLEQALPLVHNLVREELARTPNAPGSPRLRLILALFDDAIMPALEQTGQPSLPREDLPRVPGR